MAINRDNITPAPIPQPEQARRQTPLSRSEIVSAALAIVDAEGLDALSMRRLARDLHVEAMSLYHHFRNKDAILDGISAAIVSEMRLPDPLPDDWIELLVGLVDAFRRALLAHPNAVPIMLGRPLQPPEEAMITPVDVLEGQGMDPHRFLELYQALMALTFGTVFVAASTPAGTAGPETVAAQQDGASSVPVLGEDAFRKAARFLIVGFASEYAEQPGADD